MRCMPEMRSTIRGDAPERLTAHAGLYHRLEPSGEPMSTSVFALATSDTHANAMVQALTKDGFPLDDISLLIPDMTAARVMDGKQDATVLGSAMAGGATGGIIGGALGWVARIGLMAIPGFGPMIAAGPDRGCAQRSGHRRFAGQPRRFADRPGHA